MSFSLVRCDRIPVPLELIELPETSLSTFFTSNAEPGLYLIESGRLASFIERARAANPSLQIADIKRPPAPRSLRQILARVDAPTVAVQCFYSSVGRAKQGIDAYLPDLPQDRLYFLGLEPPIFQGLAGKAVVAGPDREMRRELRTMFQGGSRLADGVRTSILRAAPGSCPVLVEGERGTGKELVSRAVHRFSGRRGPLIVVNAALLRGQLADVTLFGCVKGAYTDARDRTGYFSLANGGTLFLDEIADMSDVTQAKLLRTLEYGEVTRVGDTDCVYVDVKVIAATNRDLLALVARGDFRADLYDRLAVEIIRTPSLREDQGDFFLHVARFWRDLGNQTPVADNLVKLLVKEDWPGNVRELQNFLIRLSRWSAGARPTRDLVEKCLAVNRRRTVAALSPSAERSVSTVGSAQSLHDATRRYAGARAVYLDLEQVIRTVVEGLLRDAGSSASVRSRVKTVGSLAERLQRRWADDLFKEVRDLVGLRIVVECDQQKIAVLDALRGDLDVDLGPDVVRESAWGADGRPTTCWIRIAERQRRRLGVRFGIDVAELDGHWVELQVMTKTEDLFCCVCEKLMRGRPAIQWPQAWLDELAAVKKALENVEASFERMRGWVGSYGPYCPPDGARDELRILETALQCAPGDASLAARAGKMAIALGELRRAIEILEPHVESGYGPVLRDLAVALCQLNDPHTSGYRRGLELFERASVASPRDPDVFASYAGALRRAGDVPGARDFYRRALVIDDAAPYPLGGLIEMELLLKPDSNPIAPKRPLIEKAIQRCRDQIEVSVGLPFARFNLGKLLILLGKTREAIEAYVPAIGCTNAPFMFSTTLRSVEDLSAAPCVPRAIEIARRLLAVGWVTRFPSEASRSALAAIPGPCRKISGPSVIVVGRGGHRSVREIDRLVAMLSEGLRGFAGSVIPVGDLDRLDAGVVGARGESAQLVKYRLADVASFIGGATPSLFGDEVPVPTLVAWRDILASEVSPASVLLLALGDDATSDGDRQLARQLGARVVLLDDQAGDAKRPKRSRESLDRGDVAPEVTVRDGAALHALIAKLRLGTGEVDQPTR
jgi:DNA-binding NtrC family response regulator/tetratricopeptide (TPR) repeat protein